jgi:hypothetical protein
MTRSDSENAVAELDDFKSPLKVKFRSTLKSLALAIGPVDVLCRSMLGV